MIFLLGFEEVPCDGRVTESIALSQVTATSDNGVSSGHPQVHFPFAIGRA